MHETAWILRTVVFLGGVVWFAWRVRDMSRRGRAYRRAWGWELDGEGEDDRVPGSSV